MLKAIRNLFAKLFPPTESELEDKALWCENTGEPVNEEARELCRLWRAYDLLDVRDTPRAAQNGCALLE